MHKKGGLERELKYHWDRYTECMQVHYLLFIVPYWKLLEESVSVKIEIKWSIVESDTFHSSTIEFKFSWHHDWLHKMISEMLKYMACHHRKHLFIASQSHSQVAIVSIFFCVHIGNMILIILRISKRWRNKYDPDSFDSIVFLASCKVFNFLARFDTVKCWW